MLSGTYGPPFSDEKRDGWAWFRRIGITLGSFWREPEPNFPNLVRSIHQFHSLLPSIAVVIEDHRLHLLVLVSERETGMNVCTARLTVSFHGYLEQDTQMIWSTGKGTPIDKSIQPHNLQHTKYTVGLTRRPLGRHTCTSSH